MSNYPVPPPAYGPASPQKPNYHSFDNESREPLLASSSRGGGGIYDQPNQGDLPDDFKYGVTVSDSSPEIRNAFIRKVYTILLCQIAATTLVGGIVSQSPSTIYWVQTHVWAFYIPMFGTLINLGLLFWKRHTHPWNFVLLSTFTLMESFTLGIAISFYPNVIVLQALLITTGVFLGLTLFTFQSKYDFSGMGPFLFGSLIALCMTGLVGVFIPFSRTMDLIIAIGGCLLFSGYIVYDTYMINKRMSPDEFIMGSISLYLDFINLFLQILRLLSNLQDN
jgi:FtsH-binding integral membrane protein